MRNPRRRFDDGGKEYANDIEQNESTIRETIEEHEDKLGKSK